MANIHSLEELPCKAKGSKIKPYVHAYIEVIEVNMSLTFFWNIRLILELLGTWDVNKSEALHWAYCVFQSLLNLTQIIWSRVTYAIFI